MSQSVEQAQLTAPSIETLKDAKAFDDFKQSPNWQVRLELLKANPHPYARMRYAWLRHYQGHPQQTLALLKGLPERYPLANVLYMDALADLGRHDEFLEIQAGWKPCPHDIEATIIGYELLAFTNAVILKDYHQAFRMLYRAEGIATQCDLQRRLYVIRTHIENVANMANYEVSLEQIQSPDVFGKGKIEVIRFISHIRSSNLEQIKSDKLISPSVVNLALATFEYNHWHKDISSIVKAAQMISNHLPEFHELQIYWSLLMLQIYSKKGELNGLASARRILQTLENALSKTKSSDIDSLREFAAKLYPLGLLIASKLDDRLASVSDDIAVIWSDKARDGIRFGHEKRVTIPSRVRTAFIEDGLEGSFHHTQAVFKLHATYKQRLHQALAELNLTLPEVTNVGSIYRGLHHLGKEIQHPSAIYHANELLENSSYLQSLVKL